MKQTKTIQYNKTFTIQFYIKINFERNSSIYAVINTYMLNVIAQILGIKFVGLNFEQVLAEREF